MLRKFVRQLRPTQEKYVAPVLKISDFIAESSLSKAQLEN